MKNALEIFEQIASIPHKSFHTEEMFEYICDFSKKCGYTVQSDKAKNIYTSAQKPKLCFQSHYDMVGVGEAENGYPLKLYEQAGFLHAKNSSLGADNGIGVALQLYLMQKHQDLEFLFTNDEEVGLLGARNLELKISSSYLINLDSEVFGEVVLGCAGGYDLSISFELPNDPTSYTHTYALTSTSSKGGFVGGHSGVEIHKNIKNSIVSLANFIAQVDGGICFLKGGEKINSIPVYAHAIIQTNETLKSTQEFLVQQLDKKEKLTCFDGRTILDYILHIKNGVHLKNDDGDIIDSLNLSLLALEKSQAKISLMGRSNAQALLENNLLETKNLAFSIDPNAQISLNDFYAPWERNIDKDDEFLQTVIASFRHHSTKICEMHAGLECGILQKRFEILGKKGVKMLSIGPSIFSPHSLNERLDISSFEAFCEVIANLVEKY